MYSREEINYKCSICVTLLLYVNNTSRNRVKADIHRKVWTSCNVCICCASGTKIGLMKNIGEPYIQKRIYRGLQKLPNSFSRASYGPDHLCLLWKIIACYFLLIIQSLLFAKIVDFLLVILTNHKHRMYDFPK